FCHQIIEGCSVRQVSAGRAFIFGRQRSARSEHPLQIYKGFSAARLTTRSTAAVQIRKLNDRGCATIDSQPRIEDSWLGRYSVRYSMSRWRGKTMAVAK